jgi:hypothetical protein
LNGNSRVEISAVGMKKPLRQQERLSLQGRIVPTDGRPIETFCGNSMVRSQRVSRDFSEINTFVFNNLPLKTRIAAN